MSHLSVATRQSEKRPNVSFEFFPPKNETMDERLWECVRRQSATECRERLVRRAG